MPITIPAALLDALKDFEVPDDAIFAVVVGVGGTTVQVRCCCGCTVASVPPGLALSAEALRAELDAALASARQIRDANHRKEDADHDTHASEMLRRAFGGTHKPMEN
jgi:hypothetical protein